MKRKAVARRALVTRVIGFIGFIGFTGDREFSMTLNEPVRLITDTPDVAPRGLLRITPLPAAATLAGWMCGLLGVDAPLRHRCRFFTKARTFSNAKAKWLPGFTPVVTLAERSWRTAAWCCGLLPSPWRAG